MSEPTWCDSYPDWQGCECERERGHDGDHECVCGCRWDDDGTMTQPGYQKVAADAVRDAIVTQKGSEPA